MSSQAGAGSWRILASGGTWCGEREVEAPGALNRDLERNNPLFPPEKHRGGQTLLVGEGKGSFA